MQRTDRGSTALRLRNARTIRTARPHGHASHITVVKGLRHHRVQEQKPLRSLQSRGRDLRVGGGTTADQHCASKDKTAIQRLYIEEVLKKSEEKFEFVTRGGHHRTKHPWIRTPAQFTSSESSAFLSRMSSFWKGQQSELVANRTNE